MPFDHEKLDVYLLTTTSTDDNKAILERIAQMLTKLIKSRRPIE